MTVIGTLRNPAHTGERRCVPCTIVNLVVLWLLVNVLVLVGFPIVAGMGLVGGIAVIWLRGYLLPYTPQFAPKLVASLPIPETWFHDTHESGALSPENTDGEALLVELVDTGIVEVDGERVLLARGFEKRWHEEMDRLASLSLAALADELGSLDSVPEARPIESSGKSWLAVEGQTALVPQHVAVAELGAVRALATTIEDSAQSLAMARPLREFLASCPVCDTEFEQSTEVSCCGGHTTPRETPRETLVCPSCEQRFLRLPEPATE